MTGHKRNLARRGLAGATLAALIIAGGGQVFAQATADTRLNKDFLVTFGRDFAAVVTSPFHWDPEDLRRFALVSAGTLTCLAFDKRIMNWAQAHKTEFTRDVAPVFEKTGNGAYLLAFSAALYAAGEVWRSPVLRKTALLSVESLATASVLVTAMKFVIGRARPRTGHNFYKFHPFTLSSEYNSFPSGHTAAAFAVATTIADQTHSLAVDILVYSAATLVGFSRIHDNQHWSSSVFAGGALGYFVARKIGRRHRTAASGKAADLGFALGCDRVALTMTYVF